MSPCIKIIRSRVPIEPLHPLYLLLIYAVIVLVFLCCSLSKAPRSRTHFRGRRMSYGTYGTYGTHNRCV